LAFFCETGLRRGYFVTAKFQWAVGRCLDRLKHSQAEDRPWGLTEQVQLNWGPSLPGGLPNRQGPDWREETDGRQKFIPSFIHLVIIF